MSRSIARVDLDVIRGDTFELPFTLESGFEDVIANPSAYTVRMAVRSEQSDAVGDLVSVSVVPILDTVVGGAEVIAKGTLTMTSAQTAALPDYDVVHYTELRGPSSYVKRLFSGKVNIDD